MWTSLLLKGVLIGFSIAMPVGPIGMLCIRYSLMRGMTYGLASEMGAACADALYGAVAGLGLTMVSTFLTSNHLWLRIFGALFLLYLGIKTFLSKPADNSAKPNESGHWSIFMTTFFLTLTNPLTILSFAGVYAGLGIGTEEVGIIPTLLLTLGVLVGSASWWMLLSMGASLFKKKMNHRASIWLNRISGAVMVSFGLLIAL